MMFLTLIELYFLLKMYLCWISLKICCLMTFWSKGCCEFMALKDQVESVNMAELAKIVSVSSWWGLRTKSLSIFYTFRPFFWKYRVWGYLKNIFTFCFNFWDWTSNPGKGNLLRRVCVWMHWSWTFMKQLQDASYYYRWLEKWSPQVRPWQFRKSMTIIVRKLHHFKFKSNH